MQSHVSVVRESVGSGCGRERECKREQERESCVKGTIGGLECMVGTANVYASHKLVWRSR